MRNMDKKVSLVITEEQHKLVKELAEKNYRSFSGQIRAIIDHYLKKEDTI